MSGGINFHQYFSINITIDRVVSKLLLFFIAFDSFFMHCGYCYVVVVVVVVSRGCLLCLLDYYFYYYYYYSSLEFWEVKQYLISTKVFVPKRKQVEQWSLYVVPYLKKKEFTFKIEDGTSIWYGIEEDVKMVQNLIRVLSQLVS